MNNFKKRKLTSKNINNDYLNKLVESQVQKALQQHLKSINTNISEKIFDQKTKTSTLNDAVLDTFNYSTNQIASYFIKNILRKL